MIAVTIAVGKEWEAIASLAVASCRAMTGLNPIVITETPGERDPAKAKLRLLDQFPGQTVLYFDADARFLRQWDPQLFEGTPWPVVVQDWPSRARDTDCARYGLDPQRYFASGFWISGPAQREVWAEARRIVAAADYRTAFKYEQSALNAACQRARSPLTILDRRHWWIATLDHRAPADTVCVALGGALDGPDRPAYDEAIRRATR